ncbi:MAG TPA: gluconate 2-dehydrogenase subunit 3 family protein [Candidatus Sulfotelmatobacter sp.]|nr:gluconate 2-dehydrogenase subunit 3 family protein [Candidatus Sulfotelmatobacter sp.]
MSISRRDILKSLGMTVITGSVLRVIPLEAAEYAHHMVKAEKAAAESNVYTPKFFSPHAYKTLQSLCQTIIPSDDEAKGAIEAGAPEFIDLLTSENKDYQVALGGGLMWLDNTCIDRYGNVYLDCNPEQQKEVLDLIAYRKNARKDPSLGQGIEFFSFLRKFTADGFFTSEIGINYLGYVGNTYLSEFPGCPPVPGE